MTSAELIFIGLCTFLNVSHSTSGGAPAPAVALIRVEAGHVHNNEDAEIPKHVAYIAFDTTTVELTGEDAIPLKNNNLRYVVLSGEQIEISRAPAGKTIVKPSFSTVPSRSQYLKKPPTPKWNRCIAPVRGKKPTKDCVSAYMLLGGGALSAGHLTPIEWEFRETAESAATLRDRFAREVYYRFPLQDSTLVVNLRSLATNATRTLTFKRINAGVSPGDSGDLRIWIGNSPEQSIEAEMQGLEPLQYSAGYHFTTLRMVSTPNHPFATPHPTVLGVPPGAAIGATVSDGRNPDGGYCGPDKP
jgi:hypothetical protein